MALDQITPMLGLLSNAEPLTPEFVPASQRSQGNGRMTDHKSTWISVCLLVNLVGCADVPVEETAEEPSATTQALQLPKDIGFRTIDCNANEDINLKQAWDILLNLRYNGRNQLINCINSAELVEANCAVQLNRAPLSNAILQNEFVEMRCANLNPKASKDGSVVLARAPVGISSTQLRVDHGLANDSPGKIAGVIAHEIMHNRGFRHERNPYGSQFYSLTVPEQVEACVRFGSPNPIPSGFLLSERDLCLNPLPTFCCDGNGGGCVPC